MSEPLDAVEARVVRLQPGDVLALVSDDPLTEEATAAIQYAAERLPLPEGVRVIVLDRLRLEVIRADAAPDSVSSRSVVAGSAPQSGDPNQ